MRYAKKTLLLILALMLIFVSAFYAYATPRWSYITTIAANMDFDEDGSVFITVTCDSDFDETNKITAKCELQQYDGSWKTIKTWTETNNDSVISYTKEYAVAKNYSYRLKITVSAYMNSTLMEKVTGEYAETFYR